MLLHPFPRRIGTWSALLGALLPAAALPAFRLPEVGTPFSPSGSVTILGERHRTPAGHRLFLNLVEQLAKRGERVLVGLEIPSDRQSALNAALRGKRFPGDIAHPIIDCPSYRTLLAGLGDLTREQHLRLAVTAIDAPDPSAQSREVAMASALLAAIRSGAYDRVAVLVGNLHALKEVPWAPDAAAAGPRLAGLLANAGLPVTSVLQTVVGECADSAAGRYYGVGDEAVIQRVTSLWEGMNTTPPPPGLAARAADGLVVWRCVE